MTALYVAPAAKLHRLAESIPGLLKSLKIPSQASWNPEHHREAFGLSPGLVTKCYFGGSGKLEIIFLCQLFKYSSSWPVPTEE
jgi:hypothetical protein